LHKGWRCGFPWFDPAQGTTGCEPNLCFGIAQRLNQSSARFGIAEVSEELCSVGANICSGIME
jgi:hypothetical protein